MDLHGPHRSGPLKQANKSHKTGRHRSKGAIDNALKGRVHLSKISRKKKPISKMQRRNQMNQVRKMKLEEIVSMKRRVGCHSKAPFLICILPMHINIDPKSALAILTNCVDDAVVHSKTGITYLNVPRFKQHFAFIIPPIGVGNEMIVLDYLKVCDTTLLLTSAVTGDEKPFDDWGQRIFQMMLAQGIPAPIIALMDIESIVPHRHQSIRTNVQKFVSKVFPDEKVMLLGSNGDGVNLLRRIGNQKRNTLLNRDNRPHLFGDKVEFIPDSEGGDVGILRVFGFLRGTPLNVNGLVHVLGLGDFQMERIDMYDNVYELNVNDKHSLEARLTMVADKNKQTSLETENMEDCVSEADNMFSVDNDKQQNDILEKSSKLSNGSSSMLCDYQTTLEESIGDSEEEYMSCDNASTDDEVEDDQVSDTLIANKEISDEKYDLQMDTQEEQETLKKLKEARNDKFWPDEIDTPLDIPARIRFQKYRGLESFRTSPWDPKENLPDDYSRIFEFQNFERTKRRVTMNGKEVEGASPGLYICVHISKVSCSKWTAYKSTVTNENIIVYGLLPYEHQMSVVNVVLKRVPNSTAPIRSKERLLIQCGYRRYWVNPIFSQHTNGSRHKFERFFQPNAVVCATFFAPIQFPPAPILAFKTNPNATLTLAASGFLLSCNPDRIVLKRICLSGHPARIHKKVATIRYMFFNKEDVEYFKPIKLRTKCGRVGHIKESLGTHGHMKCYFDGQLLSYDTVFMYLYKRIYPKWTYSDDAIGCTKKNNESMIE